MAKKGSNFERQLCKEFSFWWTKGVRDDIFWRSSGSGGRAKVRSKRGRDTFGQYGDIQATDPVGQPLIDLCVIEMKRGYKQASIADVLDCSKKAAIQPWEKWLQQVLLDQENSGRPYWMIISRRDKRQSIVHMPWALHKILCQAGARLHKARPHFRFKPRLKKTSIKGSVVYVLFSDFIKLVSPDNIIAVVRNL